MITFSGYPFLQCSKTCGSGYKLREVVCLDKDEDEVHEAYCMDQRKPADKEPCNLPHCEFIWITGEWSEVRYRK